MHFRQIGLSLLLALAAACAPGTLVGVGVLVAVTPSSAVIQPGAQQKFLVSVLGAVDTTVAWSVQEPTGGSIAADGTYTAPTATGTYHVVATSHADPTKSGSAVVSVSLPVGVAVTPSSAALQRGASLKFQASVSGTTDTVVAWSVQEIGGGSIGGDGTYTAPATSGAYHVVATSHADPTTSGSATVTVSSPVTVSVTPSSASLTGGTSQKFQASVTGSTDTAVAWSVQEPNGGSIAADGTYTAPLTAPTVDQPKASRSGLTGVIAVLLGILVVLVVIPRNGSASPFAPV